ncbi:WecB/TagA/CpsF family glycosyltransferase [Mycolicibacterium peregrinum]|uniref:WecB/TagA/CpsF family glycosyltransferase n=1 Tax=Mycobacteriaceae TaxID=1762 RepID=UPI003AAF5DDC
MLPEQPAARVRIGDTVVTRHTAAEVITIVADRLASSSTAPLAVGSVNLDHLHHFRCGREPLPERPEWLWLADGAPVAWRGARFADGRWPRVTGADLLEPLLQEAAVLGAQVGFLGGRPATHERLAAVLETRYPHALPARYWAPERAEIESLDTSIELAAQIRDAGVRMLVVGLGKPRQERWIAQHASDTGADVVLAFGAAADFLAGVVDRAPLAYRRYGLEWLYRLGQEPRRLARRYLVQGPAALVQLRHAAREESPVTLPSTAQPGGQP